MSPRHSGYDIKPTEDSSGWTFVLYGANGEPVGNATEVYPDFSSALRGVHDHQNAATHAVVPTAQDQPDEPAEEDRPEDVVDAVGEET